MPGVRSSGTVTVSMGMVQARETMPFSCRLSGRARGVHDGLIGLRELLR